MFVLRLTCLLIGLSFSLVFSWQVAMDYQLQPIQFLGIGSANAGEGGEGGGGGGGTAPATTKNVSLDSLLGMSRLDIIVLYKSHFREDTRVVIEGFPRSWTFEVLQAFIDGRAAARRLFRALRGVSDQQKRQNIIADHLTLATGKRVLLARDVNLTEIQIDQEKDRMDLGSGVRVEETSRLKALRQTLKEQRLRLWAAKRFESFLTEWLKYPWLGR